MDYDIDSTMLDVPRLILLGILLCQGTLEVKGRVFYDIVQDHQANEIAAEDEELKMGTRALIKYSTILLPEVALKCK